MSSVNFDRINCNSKSILSPYVQVWNHYPFSNFSFFRFYSRLRRQIELLEVKASKKIKAKNVVLIDETGNNMGTMGSAVAVQIANARGYQLVQVCKKGDLYITL